MNGEVSEHRLLKDYPSENFCDTLLVKFKHIQSARYTLISIVKVVYFFGLKLLYLLRLNSLYNFSHSPTDSMLRIWKSHFVPLTTSSVTSSTKLKSATSIATPCECTLKFKSSPTWSSFFCFLAHLTKVKMGLCNHEMSPSSLLSSSLALASVGGLLIAVLKMELL